MKILLTGSDGFMGTFLKKLLAEEYSHDIIEYDLKIGLDIFDNRQLSAKMRTCDAVVHLDGIPMYDPNIPKEDYESLNYNGSMNVMNRFIAASRPHTMVFMSSGAVYGFGPDRMDGWLTKSDMPIMESLISSMTQEDRNMLDNYSWCKLQTEIELSNTINTAATHTIGKRLVVLRPNCIEPHHVGALAGGHWGWWCSQKTLAKAIDSAVTNKSDSVVLYINVAESSCENVDTSMLRAL